MNVGSLFAGIGGFDLAAQWMGWRTAWYSEIDPYASAVMRKRFPDAANHGDITQLDGRAVEPVDLLCGGFPCQDISLAGKGAGLSGARSGLWEHYRRLIDEIRPQWVVAENVAALRSRGLDQVLGSLAALGYDAEWHCIPAAAVGAPHRRDRVWIVAHPSGSELRQQQGWGSGSGRPDPLFAAAYGAAQSLADANKPRLEGRSNTAPESCRQRLSHPRAASRIDGGWWESEPDVGRVAHGIPSRVDRLRCLGNAIVPQVAYVIFQAIERSRVTWTG